MGRRMGDAAVARALQYSWDTTAADVLSVYGEVLGKSLASG
jgi:hypothetical protein